jgi:hypothetical protein
VVDIVAEAGADFSTVASWRFWAYRETGDGKVMVFDDTGPGHVVGATPNVVAVSHTWVAGETATAGVLHAVPIAVWPGEREQSFPGASIVIQTDGT